MEEAIGAILATAIGVAISPLPIAAVIVMLLTPRARTNGPAFAVGWVLGMGTVVALVLMLANPTDGTDTANGPSTTASQVRLVLGLLLVVLAVRQWRGRPKRGEEPTVPRWLRSVDTMTPPMALGFGAAMSGINPKNLLLDVAAGRTIARAGLSTGEQAVAALVFLALASVTVVGAVIWYLAVGQRAAAKLDRAKAWLLRNNAAVATALLLVIGAVLCQEGFAGLTD